MSLCQELDLRHVHFNVKERKEENPLDLIEHSSSSRGIHLLCLCFIYHLPFVVSQFIFHFCHVFIYLLMDYLTFPNSRSF